MQQYSDYLVREWLWEDLWESTQVHTHIILIGTKPDIIKQAPLYLELKSRWILTLLIHTGQHHDYILSEWVLQEFGMIVDINLNVSGALHEKYSKIVDQLWRILTKLMEEYKKIPIPYVHGDTLTATTADKAAFLTKCSVVHVEAGIRTITPNKEFYHRLFENYKTQSFDFVSYRESLMNRTIYETGSIEPYPEQFDTRGIEWSTWFFAAPTALAEQFLINEGHDPDHIVITGNTVVDAVRHSQEKVHTSRAFDMYPNMRGKKFIFVTVHRRENTENRERFLAIFYGLKKLLQDGVPVCFLALYASEWAIDTYGLRGELQEMIEQYSDTFAYGPALAHHHEVIDMISQAWAVVMDSGSMQEEANIIGVPCVTLRFWSDRWETIIAGANVLAPPINSRLIAEIVHGALGSTQMKNVANLYGENVCAKIVDGVEWLLGRYGKLFLYDDERLELRKFIDYSIEE